MSFLLRPLLLFSLLASTLCASEKQDGYRGIWFELGQKGPHGDKYSGGLGTYTANHNPIAVYSPEAQKTFFVYGGARAGTRQLLCMASSYDHRTGLVPRPTVVVEKQGVDDPHDNASIALDGQGHVWVFVSGRGTKRPGLIYRGKAPYSTDDFDLIHQNDHTYPQPWWVEGEGFFFLMTRYTKGRELYFTTSKEGREWTQPVKLAGMGGHYQVSNHYNGRIITCFMMHPGGNVDKRTNLYYAETRDFGRTWRTAGGDLLRLPLTDPLGPGLVRNYQAEGKLIYISDIRLDAQGRPAILYVTSSAAGPGPAGEPRRQTIARWDGATWLFHDITGTTHNYDVGFLDIEASTWRVFAPSEPGPQAWGTGGEIALWLSPDKGATWKKERDLTRSSPRNHSYVRHPLHAHEGFYAFWADGDASQFSPSHLYFCDKTGTKVWRLPYDMKDDTARPERVSP